MSSDEATYEQGDTRVRATNQALVYVSKQVDPYYMTNYFFEVRTKDANFAIGIA